MADEPESKNEVVYRNKGFPLNNNNYIEHNPFVKDQHGFSLESDEYRDYVAEGATDHGTENSYNEVIKFLGCSGPESFKSVSALYTCPYCLLIFVHPKRFLIHYKWHSYGVTSLQVEFKNNKDTDSLEEDSFNDKNEQDGNFECEICNQIFKTSKTLKSHIFRFHTSSRECKICNKTLSSLSHLRAHLQTHSDGGSYSCTMCPKKFKLVHSLQRHIPTHSEEKNFPCEECDKSFGSALLLKIHFKTHMKDSIDKHLKCGYCPKTFHQSFRLVAHERTHTGVRPFQCDDCDQSYPTNSSLNRHKKVSHSSDHPFICSICNKGFHIRSALEHHIRRSHLKERPHSCQECGNSYTCQSDLNKHASKVHKLDGPSGSSSGSGIIKAKKKKLLKKKKKEYSDESS